VGEWPFFFFFLFLLSPAFRLDGEGEFPPPPPLSRSLQAFTLCVVKDRASRSMLLPSLPFHFLYFFTLLDMENRMTAATSPFPPFFSPGIKSKRRRKSAGLAVLLFPSFFFLPSTLFSPDLELGEVILSFPFSLPPFFFPVFFFNQLKVLEGSYSPFSLSFFSSPSYRKRINDAPFFPPLPSLPPFPRGQVEVRKVSCPEPPFPFFLIFLFLPENSAFNDEDKRCKGATFSSPPPSRGKRKER